MIKNIFIDWDDTLWDTYSNNRRCLEMLYKKEGWINYSDSFELFFSFYYRNNESLWNDYRHNRISKKELSYSRFSIPFKSFGIPFTASSIDLLNQSFLEMSQRQTGLVNGAKELLDTLKKQGYRIIIITNGFKEIQRNKIKNSGLEDLIDAIFVSESLGSHKPNVGFFHYALTGSNSRRLETVVVGDSLDADIKGADNAKIYSIWFNPKEVPLSIPLKFYPPLEVRKLSEIPLAIETLDKMFLGSTL